MEIDKLVQLIESPVFTRTLPFTYLSLLNSQAHPLLDYDRSAIATAGTWAIWATVQVSLWSFDVAATERGFQHPQESLVLRLQPCHASITPKRVHQPSRSLLVLNRTLTGFLERVPSRMALKRNEFNSKPLTSRVVASNISLIIYPPCKHHECHHSFSLLCLDNIELLDHFVEVQRRHQEHRRKAYKEALSGHRESAQEEQSMDNKLDSSNSTSSGNLPAPSPFRKKMSISSVPSSLGQLFRG